jgi:hypothetical protein
VTQRNPQGILLGCAYRAPDTKPDHVVLAKLSAEVRECLWHAEDCAKRAETEPNPAIQRDYIEMERRWLKLARSYQLFERIQTFSAHQEQQRGELSDRLEQLQARPKIDDNSFGATKAKKKGPGDAPLGQCKGRY